MNLTDAISRPGTPPHGGQRPQTDPRPVPGQEGGQVFRVKHGYSANSGSIGAFVFGLPIALPLAMVGLGALTALVSCVLMEHEKGSEPGGASSPESPSSSEPSAAPPAGNAVDGGGT